MRFWGQARFARSQALPHSRQVKKACKKLRDKQVQICSSFFLESEFSEFLEFSEFSELKELRKIVCYNIKNNSSVTNILNHL